MAEACRRALPAHIADALDRTVPPRLTSTYPHDPSPSVPPSATANSFPSDSDSSDGTSVEDGYAIPTTLDELEAVRDAVIQSIGFDDDNDDRASRLERRR